MSTDNEGLHVLLLEMEIFWVRNFHYPQMEGWIYSICSKNGGYILQSKKRFRIYFFTGKKVISYEALSILYRTTKVFGSAFYLKRTSCGFLGSFISWKKNIYEHTNRLLKEFSKQVSNTPHNLHLYAANGVCHLFCSLVTLSQCCTQHTVRLTGKHTKQIILNNEEYNVHGYNIWKSLKNW